MFVRLTISSAFFLILNCIVLQVNAQSSASGSAQLGQGQVDSTAQTTPNMVNTPTNVINSVNNSYALKGGDTIRIQVYGEAELTMNVLLNASATFNYPYLGELQVLGMTLNSVQQMIYDGLVDGYLVDPRVSVTMNTFREVYVGGEVSQGGNFPYSPGLTVGKAVVLAGGFTERASRKRIKVISEENDERKVVRVGLDYVLKPGDVVDVPRRFF